MRKILYVALAVFIMSGEAKAGDKYNLDSYDFSNGVSIAKGMFARFLNEDISPFEARAICVKANLTYRHWHSDGRGAICRMANYITRECKNRSCKGE